MRSALRSTVRVKVGTAIYTVPWDLRPIIYPMTRRSVTGVKPRMQKEKKLAFVTSRACITLFFVVVAVKTIECVPAVAQDVHTPTVANDSCASSRCPNAPAFLW